MKQITEDTKKWKVHVCRIEGHFFLNVLHSKWRQIKYKPIQKSNGRFCRTKKHNPKIYVEL